jgi:hypothetical protein
LDREEHFPRPLKRMLGWTRMAGPERKGCDKRGKGKSWYCKAREPLGAVSQGDQG